MNLHYEDTNAKTPAVKCCKCCEEVERLKGSLDVALRHTTSDNHPEDALRFARLHIESALAGQSRPFALFQARIDQMCATLASIDSIAKGALTAKARPIDAWSACSEIRGRIASLATHPSKETRP